MRLQDWLLRYMEHSFRMTMKQVYGFSRQLLEQNAQAVLVDVGCANGLNSRRWGRIIGTSRVLGIDLNQPWARDARSNSVDVVLADANRCLPLKTGSVDVLTAFNLLEHLVETHGFLTEIFRVLTPGGYAIIDTPNLSSWHNIAALVLGLQPFSGPNITSMTESDIPIVRSMHRRAHGLHEEPDFIDSREPERHRHVVVVAYRALLRALERVGFRIEDARGFGYYPLPPLLSRLAARLDPVHAHHMLIKARKPL